MKNKSCFVISKEDYSKDSVYGWIDIAAVNSRDEAILLVNKYRKTDTKNKYQIRTDIIDIPQYKPSNKFIDYRI